jgi:hypothetical protein
MMDTKISPAPEVPAVPPVEMGIAFALFRSAVLDEPTQGEIAPLTDGAFKICDSDGIYLERGMGVLAIHFGCCDV